MFPDAYSWRQGSPLRLVHFGVHYLHQGYLGRTLKVLAVGGSPHLDLTWSLCSVQKEENHYVLFLLFHFWLSASHFSSLVGVFMSMSSPCALTCTLQNTHSGFTSGSETWRLEQTTASQSSTWWRAAACILWEWDHSSIPRGQPKKQVSDGDALVPTSDTSAASIR